MYNTPSDLKPLLESANKNYAALRAETESRVQEWVLAPDLLFFFRPGFDEMIAEYARGGSQAAPVKKAYQYGFDKTDRPAVLRHLGQAADEIGEEFFEYQDGMVIQRSFSGGQENKRILAVSVYVVEQHTMKKYLCLSSDGSSVFETYTFNKKMLETLQRRTTLPKTDVTFFHEYSGDKTVSRILKAEKGGAKTVVYSK